VHYADVVDSSSVGMTTPQSSSIGAKAVWLLTLSLAATSFVDGPTTFKIGRIFGTAQRPCFNCVITARKNYLSWQAVGECDH
jgi:hypothetical protein